jgi:hypothetical protein
MRQKTGLNRRTLLTGAAGSALWLAARTAAATNPVRAMRVGAPTTIPGNSGDTWAMAWADDDNLYSPVNDGMGFTEGGDVLSIFDARQRRLIERDPEASEKLFAEKSKAEAAKTFGITPEQFAELAVVWKRAGEWRTQYLGDADPHIGFNRISGTDPLNLTGINVNAFRELNTQDKGRQLTGAAGPFEVGADGRTWKSSGCSFIDGALYLGISRHDYGDPFGRRLRQDAIDASFIKSTDYGKTWTRSANENLESPMFPGARFATPYFVDYGRTRTSVDGADRYAYAISNNGFWDNGDTLILARVLRARLGALNGADWEFFRGGDGLSRASWARDVAHAKPILHDPQRLGETGAVYLPARRRYMMVTWYYPDGTGHAVGAAHKTVWNFHESPHPWGPWTQIGSHTWFPQGYYCPGICPRFQSADRVYVMTAGDFTNGVPYYHLTVVPIDLS